MTTYPLQLGCPVCDLVEHFTKPGDPVAIFGWAPEFYVSTGTLPATRDIIPPHIIGVPMQDYYRHRYLEDLQRHPPKVFVDNGPQQFRYQDKDAYSLEAFPELHKYVRSNFFLADEDGIETFPELRKYVNGRAPCLCVRPTRRRARFRQERRKPPNKVAHSYKVRQWNGSLG